MTSMIPTRRGKESPWEVIRLSGLLAGVIAVASLVMMAENPMVWLSKPLGFVFIGETLTYVAAYILVSRHYRTGRFLFWLWLGSQIAFVLFGAGAMYATAQVTAVDGVMVLLKSYFWEISFPILVHCLFIIVAACELIQSERSRCGTHSEKHREDQMTVSPFVSSGMPGTKGD